ncbi:DUF1330 domain-containing protein [Actibacterium sp. 188UL27-1]|uniref:DUF1330 domain-containing protein n=1 Tax=Actibacterium sp. 188UL27-1 TaxID=2786961 RepID=UPI00195B3B64|nr:DUF1330 domain-containing protein [Actibacterium sp. 188UL27-1]MBM7069836.1 DUF1330 domain-containing protein [Actibacterium sp. 188UL27-1]
MPKGYWIANNVVHDAAAYERYKTANAAPFAKYGARFLVRGGSQENPEGAAHSRSVVLEFPSYAAALACYNDPEYQVAKEIRASIADGTLIIVEGYDG